MELENIPSEFIHYGTVANSQLHGLRVAKGKSLKIDDQAIDQAYNDFAKACGGVRQDYFGLLYLEKAHGVPREQALNQIAFHGNDYGIDGYHFDRQLRNFYLFQFKYSDSHQQFKQSFQRLVDEGMQHGVKETPPRQSLPFSNKIKIRPKARLQRQAGFPITEANGPALKMVDTHKGLLFDRPKTRASGSWGCGVTSSLT